MMNLEKRARRGGLGGVLNGWVSSSLSLSYQLDGCFGKSGRLDHQLGEGSMACMRFTLSKSRDQSFTKSSAVSH